MTFTHTKTHWTKSQVTECACHLTCTERGGGMSMCILLHFVNKIRGVCEISQQLKMQTLHSFGGCYWENIPAASKLAETFTSVGRKAKGLNATWCTEQNTYKKEHHWKKVTSWQNTADFNASSTHIACQIDHMNISAFGERVVINTLQIQLYFKDKCHWGDQESHF